MLSSLTTENAWLRHKLGLVERYRSADEDRYELKITLLENDLKHAVDDERARIAAMLIREAEDLEADVLVSHDQRQRAYGLRKMAHHIERGGK